MKPAIGRTAPRWLAATLLVISGATVARADDPLADGFRNPPATARPHTWWHWMNGNVTREGITADLEAMKRVGIAGVQLFNVDPGTPAGPVPYMSDSWKDLVLFATQEANRLGLELCVHNCAGWSSSGGPWVTPENAMQKLVFTRTAVLGGSRFEGTLAQPETKNGFYRDVAVLAFPTPTEAAPLTGLKQKAGYARADRLDPDVTAAPQGAIVPSTAVIDLTSKLDASGRLAWDAPAGEWTLLRIGYTPTGEQNHPAPAEGRGLECDKLSREAMDQFWSGQMAAVLDKVGALAPKTLNNALIDSYEVGCQNWTPKFREEFIARRGYDPLPYLPVVDGTIIESRARSERFLWDLRRTVADLYADNYYGYFTELCHKKGMLASTEPYGNGIIDNMQSGGRMDIPMGEFWINGAAISSVKLASSIGHTYGRPIVGAESFTSSEADGRWALDPFALKAIGDRAFTLGLNRVILHRYAMQPWKDQAPGMTMGRWGTHFDRTETWWDQSAAWLQYLARCQYLLQAGRFVADVLYFTGDGAPNDLPARETLDPKMPAGYDYDGCDPTILRGSLTVKDGRLVLPSGMSYRVLVLPNSPFMTLETLRKVRDLVRAGATVVGPKPQYAPGLTNYPRCDDEVRQIADEVWGGVDGGAATEHTYGAGRVIWGRPLAGVLAAMQLEPDFTAVSKNKGANFLYIHRTVGDAEVYFVSNQRQTPEQATFTFRVSGMSPEIWRADRGTMEPAAVWAEVNGTAEVPLRLDPAGSAFVVFRRNATAPHLAFAELLPAVSTAGKGTSVQIHSAVYGGVDGRVKKDVTNIVRARVAKGQYDIGASNALFGDPAYHTVKQLTLDYSLNGERNTVVVPENQSVSLLQRDTSSLLPATQVGVSGAALTVTAWEPGQLRYETPEGKHLMATIEHGASAYPVEGGWDLYFPPKKGAPEHVALEKLISWPAHADSGVRYFSGTAEYRKTVDVPAAAVAPGRTVMLDLGRVKNLATVSLNGKDLGVLWKPPFQLDVNGLLKPGKNSLVVRVTNLWPNRLIGDAQLPEDVEWAGNRIAKWPQWLLEGKPRPSGRIAFATYRYYTKDSPLLESGLIGPVVVRSAPLIALKGK